MRLSKLVGKRIKETPKDAQTTSHIFLVRGGYVRQVSTGIYTLLPLAKRIKAKVEAIIRQEMDNIEGQEILMPVALPSELWEESGRLHSVGPELLRFSDRNKKEMVLGMTHEEAVVHAIRTDVNSYKQLPVMLYQIQTKYRDEARPRAGLIRVREFTMKDAYSFHTSQECLDAYYQQMHDAYSKIFKKIGFKDVVSIQSDPGMMGGNTSHEFMAIADCGEDTIFMSPNGEYKANKDIAQSSLPYDKEQQLPLEKVHTPGKKTIDEVAEFLGIPTYKTGKAVFYADADENVILVIIRGDIDVNEIKLKNYLSVQDLQFATDEQIRGIGCVPGYASPLNIDCEKVRVIFDRSAANEMNLIVGANEEDYHYRDFNFSREMASIHDNIDRVDLAVVREGDPCTVTGEPLMLKRGIEIGNIFQLGTKYTDAMGCSYLDKNGKSQTMIMGCYGIGIGRIIASVIEQSNDKYGPIWPFSIAPYHVHICAIDSKKPEVKYTAENLYTQCRSEQIEALYDDRSEKPGSMFNDADLIGVPLRIIISPKTLARNEVEFKTRDGTRKEFIPLNNIIEFIKGEIHGQSS